jgi:hypothetical protein
MPRPGQPGGLSDELDPYVDQAETDRFDRMGELLRSRRPAPSQGFLARLEAGPEADAPAGLRAQVAAALLIGLLLLGLALLGASGSGPLGG